jgi:DNA polymerase III delta subunit
MKIKSISINFLQKIFNKIKKTEQLVITKKAEKFILNVCNNSIRLLVNYMEKFKLLQLKITEKMAKEICTNISFYEFEKYTNAWFIEKDLPKAIKILFSIFNKGYSVMDILDSYFLFVKTTDIMDENSKYKLIKYICKYISIFHTVHEAEIELALFTNELNKNI